MWKVCLQTFRNNRICVKNQHTFKEIHKLHGQITRELLGLRIRNFLGIVFIWKQTYMGDFQICNSVTLTAFMLIFG